MTPRAHPPAGFSEGERALLLATPGIGPSVVRRLEDVGIDSLDRLRELGPATAVALVCAHLGSTAWRNRRRALENLLRVHARPVARTGLELVSR